MTTARLTREDRRIRAEVMHRLEIDPDVDASEIAAFVHDHVVTLTGFTGSYAGKLSAERAAKLVRGVRAVANDVRVVLMLDRTDTDIASEAARELERRLTVPDTVQVVVHSGWITLTGTAHWAFQKHSAENAVRHVKGAKGVVNRIRIVPPPAREASRRQWETQLEEDGPVGVRVPVH